jgi:hypothetical protein
MNLSSRAYPLLRPPLIADFLWRSNCTSRFDAPAQPYKEVTRMARRIVLVAMALLLMPTMALADSVDFSFVGGVLTLTGGGALTSSGLPSTLSAVDRNPQTPTPDYAGVLGSFSLTTGAASGSLALGTIGSSVTLAGGGSITAIANGSWGSIASGTTLFNGTFTGPVTWTLVNIVGNNYFYTLTGNVSGALDPALVALLFPGCTTCGFGSGSLFTLNISSTGAFSGSANIQSGNMSAAVPEPATLALFGSGLIMVAGVLRRRKWM